MCARRVVDMLRELGYQRAARRECGSRAQAAGRRRSLELLFTDVVMPGPIPTREFTRQVQQMRPGICVLYTSGYTQNAIVHNGRLDDDAFLLSKPYRKDELARKIRSVLAAPPQAAERPMARVSKVLVVEDVPIIRMATMDMIEQIGFRAAEAGDGERSARAAREGSRDRDPAHRSGPAGHERPAIGGEGEGAQAGPEGDHRFGLFQRRQWPWPRCRPSHQAV